MIDSGKMAHQGKQPTSVHGYSHALQPVFVRSLVNQRENYMGFWGAKPYENDDAADWFRHLWAEFPVPKKVEETLNLDVETNHAQIRAAIHILLLLGDTYQWPIDDIDRHLDLAATRLEEMLELEFYSDDDFRD
jgi:hypothetical protein